ncbi:MAG: acyltransferase [Oscillospiraceae bacterium]
MSEFDEYLPWTVQNRDTAQQMEIQNALREKGSTLGKNCFISCHAQMHDAILSLGSDCLICADALVRHANVHAGNNCTVNTFAYLQGNIRMGNDVRIAPRASIIADNHNHSDITCSIVSQGTAGKGIVIGDDVWIGANTVLVDGITVGSHSIIAAGSVVTKNVSDYVIMGGNPAHILKNRIETYFAPKLEQLLAKVTQQLAPMVEAHVHDGAYVDLSKGQSNARAWCDAVELLALFGKTPSLMPKEQLIQTLQKMQSDSIDYNVLSVGYALETLGTHVEKPYRKAMDYSGEELVDFLQSFAWHGDVWHAGDAIDCLGTAFYQNQKYFGITPDCTTLFAWLDAKANPDTGLWGEGTGMDNVNGFYRLTRGTYAQFSHPLPYPEKTIDTVLAHSENLDYFAEENGTSCNVLDVIHPLWLCHKQTEYRYSEGRSWAFGWIDKIIANWSSMGFSFDLLLQNNPTLMATEMWLAILWLLCDYVGIAHLLPYIPQGVHRPQTSL